jgi:hypothetical protein
MNASPFIRRVSVLAAACALVLGQPVSFARISMTAIVEAKLGGHTILNAPQAQLISAVEDCAKDSPLNSPLVVRDVLGGGRADADALAPKVTTAAIQGLGSKASESLVGNIVFCSVKATPTETLEIVRAAVRTSPTYARAIVKSAVSALPDPNAKVQPLSKNETSGETQGPDGFTKDDSKDDPKGSGGADPLPIGEAIAHAAMLGDPSLSLGDLLDASTGGSFTELQVYPGYFYPPPLPQFVTPTLHVVSK